MTPTNEPPRGRLRPARLSIVDVSRLGGAGLRTRPLRAFLAGLGVAIGIAAMVGVVGITTSSKEDLNRQLARLGTNLLRVTPGKTVTGDRSQLPTDTLPMIRRIPPVTSASATGDVTDTFVYRSDRIPVGENGSIAVLAARTDLLGAVGGSVARGTWLNEATAHYPAVVLGAATAVRLGLPAPGPDVQVWLGKQWFTVVGILNPVVLTPEIDNAALVGWPAATERLHFDGYPTTIYVRTEDDSVGEVWAVLGRTVDPEHPNRVRVSRPSDALAARQTINTTLNGLVFGLGAVALLVGGIGVANTMVISVLERRAEIGLRRSLGATRGQIRLQFLTESLTLAALGGLGGSVLGTMITIVYSIFRQWPSTVPAWATAGAVAVTILIGALAGLYPAARAARLQPTEALATPG